MYIKEEIQDKPHDISAVTENNSIRTKIVSIYTYYKDRKVLKSIM